MGVPVNNNKKESSFIVSDEIIDATTKVKDLKSDSYAASNVLNGCEINVADRENSIDSNDNKVENDSIEDNESLDEGVGDISSDCEQPNSPNFEADNSDKNDNLADISTTTSSEQPDNVNTVIRKLASPTKERLPSRFSFDK